MLRNTHRFPNIWSHLITEIRHKSGWNQEQIASALGANQSTVSRWENGSMLPRPAVRRKLEELSAQSGSMSLIEIATFVRESPNKIILSDKNSTVIAASESSAFVEGRTIYDQCDQWERQHYVEFHRMATVGGFWQRECRRLEYVLYTGDGRIRAIITAISLGGDVFALTQKAE